MTYETIHLMWHSRDNEKIADWEILIRVPLRKSPLRLKDIVEIILNDLT